MSSIDIILMGMLTEEPHNAYEINKIIEARRTRTWLRISTAAVYRNLRRLHEEGHLEATTTRDGLKPHKTVFSITPEGRDHFVELLRESAQGQVGLHFDFDAWVAHIHHLPAPEALTLLDGLRLQLAAIRDELAAVSTHHAGSLPTGAAALVELRLKMLEVTLDWVDGFETGPSGDLLHNGPPLLRSQLAGPAPAAGEAMP
ncbi:MAG: PadR family transcriptional regulator [Actinomycetia bacterium]|nr:PadR family transcriptional regulator [Actinomycetes bacterium]